LSYPLSLHDALPISIGPSPFDEPPAISHIPAGSTRPPQAISKAKPARNEEPIRILNVIVDEVTSPRLDGTPGSALYAIPLRLNRDRKSTRLNSSHVS